MKRFCSWRYILTAILMLSAVHATAVERKAWISAERGYDSRIDDELIAGISGGMELPGLSNRFWRMEAGLSIGQRTIREDRWNSYGNLLRANLLLNQLFNGLRLYPGGLYNLRLEPSLRVWMRGSPIGRGMLQPGVGALLHLEHSNRWHESGVLTADEQERQERAELHGMIGLRYEVDAYAPGSLFVDGSLQSRVPLKASEQFEFPEIVKLGIGYRFTVK